MFRVCVHDPCAQHLLYERSASMCRHSGHIKSGILTSQRGAGDVTATFIQATIHIFDPSELITCCPGKPENQKEACSVCVGLSWALSHGNWDREVYLWEQIVHRTLNVAGECCAFKASSRPCVTISIGSCQLKPTCSFVSLSAQVLYPRAPARKNPMWTLALRSTVLGSWIFNPVI